MKMLVTRPMPEAEETAGRLRALDLDAVVAPLLQFEPLPTSLPEAQGFAALALTSAHALRALEARGVLDRYTVLPVYAVGERTAAVARAMGFGDVRHSGGGLAELAQLLSHAGLSGPVFYPAARHTAGDLAKSLAPFGVMVVTARVYDMVPVDGLDPAVSADLTSGAIGAALFYSQRTAEVFVQTASAMSDGAKRSLGMLCLSEQVAAPLIEAQFVRLTLADQPSEEAMMALALAFARDQTGQ